MIAPSNPPASSSVRAGSAASTQIVVGMVVAVVVSLLTVLFSFLGTLTSGAIIGMLFGTAKPSKWKVALVSLVFPLVSLAFSQALTLSESLELAALCLGVFWVSYLFTCIALHFEQAQSPSSAPALADRSKTDQPVIAATPERGSEPTYDPNLIELQGRWARQSPPRDGVGGAETIEVLRDRVLLTLSGANGQARTVYDGHVHVTQVGPYKVVAVLPPERAESAPSSRFVPTTWLYKVVGEKLTIGWNFDNKAPGQVPVVEDYRRET